jgi:hypothetical protein
MKNKSALIGDFLIKLNTYETRDGRITAKMLDNQLVFITLLTNIGVRHPEVIVDDVPILEFVNKHSTEFQNMAEQMIENFENIKTLIEEYDEALS